MYICKNKTKFMNKELTLNECIDRRIKHEGRKQTWVVQRLNDMGNAITEVSFSRKKMVLIPFLRRNCKTFPLF